MGQSRIGLLALALAVGCGHVVDVPATPVLSMVVEGCGIAPVIRWMEVAGATYTLSYGPAGNLTDVELPVGTTSYAPQLDMGDYVAHIRAHLDGTDSAVSADTQFHVTATSAFAQTTTADFDANTNTSIQTDGDQLQLVDDLDVGTGTVALNVTTNTTLAGGPHDYSSVTIAAGATLTVTGTSPLVIRSTGTVTIAGVIDARGQNGTSGVSGSTFGLGGAGGAGGAKGGDGVFVGSPADGVAGQGTGGGGRGIGWSGGGGGGYAAVGGSVGASNGGGIGGTSYNTAMIASLVGGSGGGGGSGGNNCGSGGGGGGGGFVKISAPTITINSGGAIHVDGGAGGSDGNGNCGGGGGGSGGVVHLRARNLTVAGAITASGGAAGGSAIPGSPFFGVGGVGADGRIRIDATSSSTTGAITPAPGVNGSLTIAATGSTRTPLIVVSNTCWGTVSFTADTPTGSAITVNVLDSTNTVLVANVASGATLSSVPATTRIKLEADFTSTGNVVPTLRDWSVSYSSQ